MLSVQIKQPELILGTVQLGLPYGVNNSGQAPDTEVSQKILDSASEGGISFLDTSEAYGDSLVEISKAIARGLNFRIYSKVKPGTADLSGYLERLCERIGVSHLEGISLHSDIKNFSSKELMELKKAKEKGLFHLLGVSLYGEENLPDILNDDSIDLVQIPYNVLDGWCLRGSMMKKLKDSGKLLHIRSVFLQGLFFHSGTHKAATLLARPLLELKEIAENWPGGMAQMAIDYVRSNSFIDGVLIGAETPEQVKANCEYWRKPLVQAPLPPSYGYSMIEQTALDPRTWK